MQPDDLTAAETDGMQRIIDTVVDVASDLPTDSTVRAWCLRCAGLLRNMLGQRATELSDAGSASRRAAS